MELYDELPDVITTAYLIQRFEKYAACITPNCDASVIHELAAKIVVMLKAFKEQEDSPSPDREYLNQREAEITVDMLAFEKILARYRFEAEMDSALSVLASASLN